ncbi:AEC family transporter [Pectinatus haikarae]|uniref:AEC family transporter n=1 Tax=Pectinatus haikarae TaxID=349096 RepID=UPI0018C68D76|nr:AEC family transporter [Pectinatus haikarae]
MEQSNIRIIYIFIDLILPLMIGYLLHQKKWMSMETCNMLLKVNIRVVATILALGSFWLMDIGADFLIIPIYGIVVCLIPGFLSYPLTKHIKNPRSEGAFLLTGYLSNIGTLIGLCGFVLYGEMGFAYVQAVAIFQNVFTLLVCIPMAGYYHQLSRSRSANIHFRPQWRDILVSWNQLALIGVIIGFFLSLFHVPRPDIFSPVFDSLVHIGAWIGMLPIGFLIKFSSLKIYLREAIMMLPIKFIILPFMAYLVFFWISDNKMFVNTMTLISAAPAAINSIAISQLYKLNTNISTAIFMVTTAIFFVVVFPVFYLFVYNG